MDSKVKGASDVVGATIEAPVIDKRAEAKQRAVSAGANALQSALAALPGMTAEMLAAVLAVGKQAIDTTAAAAVERASTPKDTRRADAETAILALWNETYASYTGVCSIASLSVSSDGKQAVKWNLPVPASTFYAPLIALANAPEGKQANVSIAPDDTGAIKVNVRYTGPSDPNAEPRTRGDNPAKHVFVSVNGTQAEYATAAIACAKLGVTIGSAGSSHAIRDLVVYANKTDHVVLSVHPAGVYPADKGQAYKVALSNKRLIELTA